MSTIERGNMIENAIATLTAAHPPLNGTNAVQTLSVSGAPTGGVIPLGIFGETASLPYNATAAQAQSLIGGLSSIGNANVLVGGGPLPSAPLTFTFQGQLGVMPVPPLVPSSARLTGGTNPAASVASTVPGVLASGRNSRTGQIYADETPGTGELWQNQGVPPAPNWVKVGPQT